jgi:hypothetical protein
MEHVSAASNAGPCGEPIPALACQDAAGMPVTHGMQVSSHGRQALSESVECLGHVVCTAEVQGVEDGLGERLNTLATHIHNGSKWLLKLSDPSPELCECIFEEHAEVS